MKSDSDLWAQNQEAPLGDVEATRKEIRAPRGDAPAAQLPPGAPSLAAGLSTEATGTPEAPMRAAAVGHMHTQTVAPWPSSAGP